MCQETSLKVSKADAVPDGDIDRFIQSYLMEGEG